MGEKLAAAAKYENPDIDEAIYNKQLNSPMRAPLVVIAVAKITEHPKVPEIEQLLSAGAAVTKMLTAAHAWAMRQFGAQAQYRLVVFLWTALAW